MKTDSSMSPVPALRQGAFRVVWKMDERLYKSLKQLTQHRAPLSLESFFKEKSVTIDENGSSEDIVSDVSIFAHGKAPRRTSSWTEPGRRMNETLPRTIRRGVSRRAVFSESQRTELEERFQTRKYISKPDRKRLAESLGLKDSQVKVWFQNRRMKWRNSKERELLSSNVFVTSKKILEHGRKLMQ